MTDDVALLPLLTVVSGPMQGTSFRLRSETCLIGRDNGVDILVEDFRVSRRHAVIERSGGRLTLADVGSTNGTWLNGERLTGVAELRDGDRVRLGSVECRFYEPASASTEPVGTAIRALSLHPLAPRAPGGAERPPVSALFGPTQPMATGRRAGRPWLVLAASILVAAGLVWGVLLR
jgi:hypothetical protein